MNEFARKLRELADEIDSAGHDTEALPVYPTLPGYPWTLPIYPVETAPAPPHCCRCGRVFPVITWTSTTTADTPAPLPGHRVTTGKDCACDH